MAGVVVSLSCGGESTGPDPDPVAAALGFSTAPSATAEQGVPLAQQPVVELRTSSGQRVARAGVAVAARVTTGTLAGTITINTNAEGRAAFTNLALGGAAGPRDLEFTSSGLTTARSTVTLGTGSAMTIRAASTATVSAPAGSTLPTAPAVIVEDAGGNPVQGATVTFTVTGGNGTVSGATAETDAQGRAAPGAWTLGPLPGTNTLRAALGGSSATVNLFASGVTTAGVITGSAQHQVAVTSTPVAAPPAITLTTSGGAPIPNVAVQFSVVTGGGTLDVTEATTDASGVASAGSWTLGAATGLNEVSVIVVGYSASALVIRAHAVTDLPVHLVVHAGGSQDVAPGNAVGTLPAVRVSDDAGQPVVSYPITFAGATDPFGTITGASTSTDQNGVATVGSWTPPSADGTYRLSVTDAQLTGSPAEFVATVSSDAPSNVVVSNDNRTGVVGTVLASPPLARVVNSSGTGVAGVPVTFDVVQGGGSLAGSATATDADGYASPGSWTLGTTAGAQAVVATAPGVGSVTLHATAQAGQPVSIEIAEGNNQLPYVWNPVPVAPGARLRDQYGNPTPGYTVSFAAGSGGGRVTIPSASTGEDGIARTHWHVGGTTGTHTMTASSALAGAAVQFSASAQAVASDFDIELRYIGTPPASSQLAAEQAVARWRAVLRNDLPSTTVPANACGTVPAAQEVVDDIIIYIEIATIDGSGGVLGSAGPCSIRLGGLPSSGIIILDVADANALASTGELRDVMLHEMGHVLGLGTVWEMKNLISGATTPNSSFTGAVANSWYHFFGGTLPNTPLETTGGAGTRDSHWRETVFGPELMTGFIGGTHNPMSKVTIGSMVDIGYTADFAIADPLPFALNVRASMARAAVPTRRLTERPLTTPILVVYPDGRVVRQPR